VSRAASGGEELEGTYSSLDGTPVVSETALLVDGALRSYRIQLHQWKETGTVRVEEGQIQMRLTGPHPEKRRDDDVDGDVVVPITLFDALRRNIGELRAGRSIAAQLVLIEACRTVRVKVQPILVDANYIVVKVRPSNILIRLLAGADIEIALDRRTGVPLWYRGRVLPKAVTAEGLRDLDAKMIFSASEDPAR
jgi:phage baseplate assembly protein gpV